MEQAVMETVGSELVNLSIRWKIFELIDTARSCATKAQAQAQGQCDKYRKDLVDDINYLSVKLRYCEGRNQAELGSWRMAGLEETLEMSEKVVGECVELLKDNVPLSAWRVPNPANRLKVLLSCIDMKIQDYEVWRKLEGIRRSVRLNTRSKKDQESAVADTGVVMFTRAELLAGCNNWFVNNELSKGRHGCKYWGVLPKGRLAAVKRIDDEAVMFTELKVIPHPRDGHFARVLGYYADKREHLLVTEYMPNGSLYDHLHGRQSSYNSPVISSWKTRLGIALGVAKAIYYLQTCYPSPIIHTGIASRHILLDKEFMPRLSGLGSAIWPQRPEEYVKSSSLGTAGYIDPDYYMHKGYMTPASDVYSFGVLLVELLTGKDPFELYSKNDDILNYINARDRDLLWKALDRRPPARLELVQALLPLGDTLKGCVAVKPGNRPTISNVVSDIKAVLANLPQGYT